MNRRAPKVSIAGVVVLSICAAMLGREAGAQLAAPQFDTPLGTPQLGGTGPLVPQGQVVLRPSITNVTAKCGGLVGWGRAIVNGRNFGAAANGRKVKLVKSGQTIFFSIASWKDTQIEIHLGNAAPGGTVGLTDAAGTFVTNTVSIQVGRAPAFSDEDGDGHESIPSGGDDCDDCDGRRYPHNAEICDAAGHDEDCEPTTYGERDADGDRSFDSRCWNEFDGHRSSGNDCNDSRSDIHPRVPEVCNGWDDNCDGVIDDPFGRVIYRDGDGDGFGDPRTDQRSCVVLRGYSERSGDCNDADPAIKPGQGCPATCR